MGQSFLAFYESDVCGKVIQVIGAMLIGQGKACGKR